jgi:hypothetical protein
MVAVTATLGAALGITLAGVAVAVGGFGTHAVINASIKRAMEIHLIQLSYSKKPKRLQI